MYAISTLLFLVAKKASREHKRKLTYYFASIVAQLRNRRTRNFLTLFESCTGHTAMDRTWERSANYSARTSNSCYLSPHRPLSQ